MGPVTARRQLGALALALLAGALLPEVSFGQEIVADAEPAPSTATSASVGAAPVRRARTVDLDAPVDAAASGGQHATGGGEPEPSAQLRDQSLRDIGSLTPGAQQPPVNTPFVMLGAEVPSGTSSRLAWQPGESFAGIAVPTPVLVVHGASSGPVVCLTAAVHGDELNGIEMVRRVLYELDPTQLKGTVVGVPIVNLLGFKRSSRYLPDRRDLNRHFPGNPNGSSASRIAYSFFNEIVKHCNVLVDLHTGSFYRSNLPQLRADLRRPEVAAVAASFASTAIVQSAGADGSLRRAAVDAGVATVTLEAGEPMRLQASEVDHGVQGIFALIDQLGMYRKLRVWGNPAPVHYESRWVRADSGGILFGKVSLGDRVHRGELLGTVTDPITNVRADILSPYDGRVIGLAVDQVVLPGFAAFHIGIQPRAGAAPGGRPLPEGAEPNAGPDDPGARDNVEDS
jgi:predicted deacylase